MTTPTPESRAAGARIRAVRERVGMSQHWAAIKADLAPSTLSHIENGRRPCNPKRRKAIADALGVPVNELMVPMPDPRHDAAKLDAMERQMAGEGW